VKICKFPGCKVRIPEKFQYCRPHAAAQIKSFKKSWRERHAEYHRKYSREWKKNLNKEIEKEANKCIEI